MSEDDPNFERATLNQILGMQTEMLRYQRTREENEQKRYEVLRNDVRQLRQEQHEESMFVRNELQKIKDTARHDADVGMEGLVKAEALQQEYHLTLAPKEWTRLIVGIGTALVTGIFALLATAMTHWGLPSWFPSFLR